MDSNFYLQTRTVNERLRPLVDPRSVAILGASAEATRIGGMPIALMKHHRFSGTIYPINPKYKEIDGLTCYPDIDSLPGPVDLIVIAVGAKLVAGALRAAAAKGIRSAVILAAGFGEDAIGEGPLLQAELVAIARETGVVIAGPNCMGFANLDSHAYSTFTAIFKSVVPPEAPRTVSIITQSGSVCTALYAAGRSVGVPYSLFLNTGNEACVEFSEYLEYISERPLTGAVIGYVEGLRDGSRFARVAARMRDHGQLLAIFKSGNTAKGADAARLHTGADAGSQVSYQAAFKRLGVIQSASIRHLADMAYLSRFRNQTSGTKVAIVSNSGAFGAILSDLFQDQGIGIPTLSEPLQDLLRRGVPSYGMVHNPVDMTGNVNNSHAFVADALGAIATSGEADFLVFAASGFLIDRFAPDLIEVAKLSSRLIAVISIGKVESQNELEAAGVVLFDDPGRASAALSSFAHWHEDRRIYAGMGIGAALQIPDAMREILLPALVEERVNLSRSECISLANEFALAGFSVDSALLPDAEIISEIGVSIRSDPIFGPIVQIGIQQPRAPSQAEFAKASLSCGAPLPLTAPLIELMLEPLQEWKATTSVLSHPEKLELLRQIQAMITAAAAAASLLDEMNIRVRIAGGGRALVSGMSIDIRGPSTAEEPIALGG